MGIIEGAAVIYYHVKWLVVQMYMPLWKVLTVLITSPQITFGYHSYHSYHRFRNNEWWLENCKTMGTRITKVDSIRRWCWKQLVQLPYSLPITLVFPVSTTHTITGSIIGVGLTKRVSAVRWGVTISLLWAWIITIPISAVIAALCYLSVIAL